MYEPVTSSSSRFRKPLVSVIMNCFNGEEFLHDAINSILSQTYLNWELIFWDNQSTDKSAEIFRRFNDLRMKYFFASTHTLLYEARNLALEKSSGEFIAFLDVDDLWETDKLEKQIPLFNNPEVALVYGNFWLLDHRHNRKKKLAHCNNLPQGMVLNRILNKYQVGLSTIVIRRESLLKLGLNFDVRFQIIGDFDIVIRISASWKLAYLNSPVSSYRKHKNNLSLLESGRTIRELEIWYLEMSSHPIIGTQPELKSIQNNITYLRIIEFIKLGKRINAVFLFFKYPLNLIKIKLFVAILLPKSVIQFFR